MELLTTEPSSVNLEQLLLDLCMICVPPAAGLVLLQRYFHSLLVVISARFDGSSMGPQNLFLGSFSGSYPPSVVFNSRSRGSPEITLRN